MTFCGEDMDIVRIIQLAKDFRSALDIVVEKNQYGRLTIFRHFPKECCSYTSDLLAEYLMENGIPMERIQTINSMSNAEDYTHCWLLIDDDIFVDITADQFNGKTYFKEYEPIPKCYVASCQRKYLYDCFKNHHAKYSRNVGIHSYSGDTPTKLQALYDAITRQIKSDLLRR